MVKNKKQKGSYAERELVKMLWERGYASVRAAGSGSGPLPSPDVVASNGRTILAFECKFFSAEYVHLNFEQIAQLVEFSQKFGAVPFVAIRYAGKEWRFLDMARVERTRGENFKESKTFAHGNGLTFDQLLDRFEKLESV